MKLLKFLPAAFLLLYTAVAFGPFFIQGRLPIPADTIVGMYYPWYDVERIPFKNFLTTDPVRQQYPWRELAISGAKWNPYSFAGVPLTANWQTAVFYPLNIIHAFLPFSLGWSWQIVLQTVLGGLFMWLYLRHLKLHPAAQALGVMAWVGSGFFVAWGEWNTLVQSAIWLPLILLLIDRQRVFLLALTLAASFLAGHPQVFSYIFIVAALYSRKRSFTFATVLFFILTSVQWWPAITFLREGVRSVGVNAWQEPGWFLPWQNLAQFIAPDFFGNPATLNYFGVWNYGEFIGYVGIVPLIFAFAALFSRQKKTLFWIGVLAAALIFSTRNFLSELPFRLQIPFVSLSQPTRLMVLIDFSLAVLAAFGLDFFLKNGKRVFKPVIISVAAIAVLWIIALKMDLIISQKNLILPTALVLISAALLAGFRKIPVLVIGVLLAMTVFDLSRFSLKFESFSKPEWLYPKTKITGFLQEQLKGEVFRVAALDDRIFPPNFSVHYKIQMISGYDSVFLKNYAGFVSPNGGFNRILTPKDLTMFDQLNVKYVLTFDYIKTPGYEFIFQEGMTKVFENKNVFPRVTLPDGQAIITKYLENEVEVTTKSSSQGVLILRDNFYPGWQADIDGKSAAIIPVEKIFRGVNVPPGEHVVTFSYHSGL